MNAKWIINLRIIPIHIAFHIDCHAFSGYFPLESEHCLVWICLDVLFCTSSIMHLCTISIDRYLSLRYPMRFGRNKTRKRVVLKIFFVWLLSIAMSLPLSLMYSKVNLSQHNMWKTNIYTSYGTRVVINFSFCNRQDHASVLVDGTCQIPDPVYKLVGSIVCFYIPLLVMLLTYALTVRLLARQRQSLGGGKQTSGGWSSGWLGIAPVPPLGKIMFTASLFFSIGCLVCHIIE